MSADQQQTNTTSTWNSIVSMANNQIVHAVLFTVFVLLTYPLTVKYLVPLLPKLGSLSPHMTALVYHTFITMLLITSYYSITIGNFIYTSVAGGASALGARASSLGATIRGWWPF